MAARSGSSLSYLKKVFFFTHATGIGAGLLFPLAIRPLFGPQATSPGFLFSCLVMGYVVGAAMFFFVRFTLKKQLRQQLDLLRPLTGEVEIRDESVEALHEAVATSVSQVESLVQDLLSTIGEFVPLYRAMADGSRYLSDRANEGLQAALETERKVGAMESRQQEIAGLVQQLTSRTQDEASMSRELSASLEEMASAMDHSTAKFLETSASVDELAASVVEVSSQAEAIARNVEGTAQDLDDTRSALQQIREGVQNSARQAEAVQKDAENGMDVVRRAIDEMDRIEQDSQQARQAMERLAAQTGEVAKIIEVIRELVSDTELLAFNAAIIAAKAGAEGKGFSVVADEIRDLADRTTTSAQEIQKIVKAIGQETREVTSAVDATGRRIENGKQLSRSAGEALEKIINSSREAARASEEIATTTGSQAEKAGILLEDAGHSLRSVKAVARAIQEQQAAIARIQEGVTQMKAASDQIARGMEEQVQANRDFDKGLADRERQVSAIQEAVEFQRELAQKVFDHFATSQDRLRKNAERAGQILDHIERLETLAERLRQQAESFQR
ncbi:MAG: HAMP domain-containing methyl-accepting chemotaxis protein [Geothermobacteraceae bacterium]